MSRPRLSDSFSEWSPDLGTSDNNSEDIYLPSILHPYVIPSTSEEPLLHHNTKNYDDEDDEDDDEDYEDDDNDKYKRPTTLVDRADTLEDTVRYRLLAQLVGDGLHTRQFAVDLINEHALWWYEYSHSHLSRNVYSIAMVFFLLLVFFEAPSSNSFATRTALVPAIMTVPIEIVLISIVWTDIYAQVRYQGSEWRKQLCRRTWLRGRVFVALVITIDLICTVWTPGIVRFSRPFRVWLLLSRMRNLRNAISMAVRTLPNVALIGTFLLFLVLLFSIVGWLIFDPANEPWKQIAFNTTKSGLCSTFTPVCNGYFDTFPNTLYQMWILLGGINYPAVALPYLEVSFFSAFFFVTYLTLGQVFLMRLLITAAYGAYREELFKRIQKRENRTHTAFSSAFNILIHTNRNNYNGIELHVWLRLVHQVRPKFRKEVARAIFLAAQDMSAETKQATPSISLMSNETTDEGKETSRPITATTPPQQQQPLAPLAPIVPIVTSYDRFVEMLHMLDVQTGHRPSRSRNRWGSQSGCLGYLRRASWSMYRLRWVRRSFDVLAIFSVLRLILVRTGAAPDYGRCVEHYVPSCSVDMIGYVVMTLFFLEQLMKTLALGWREYWTSWLNRLDFAVSSISITATIIVNIVEPLNHANVFMTLAQILPVVRLLRVVGQVVRLIRLLRFSNGAKRMLALVTHVIPNATRLLAIIASALYFYSVVGMESFAGCLSNQTLVAGSSYDVQNMHALNFDTFGRSLMTSFTMLLVRKYPVFLEGTIACFHQTTWPMMYYFSFYILVVCFLLNVFVAFILAVFNEVESVQRVDDEYRRQLALESRARHREREALVGDKADQDYVQFNNEVGDNKSIESRLHRRSRSAFPDTLGARRMERTYSNFGGNELTPKPTEGLHRSRGAIHLRGKVQDLLLRCEDPYSSTPKKDDQDMSHIILRSSGPKARDVEALMLKRHKASNSGGSQKAFMSAGDMIEQKMFSLEDRQHLMASLQQIAASLNVDIDQISINSAATATVAQLSSRSVGGLMTHSNNGHKKSSSRSDGERKKKQSDVRSSRSVI